MNVKKRRERGRPNKKWLDAIECDMKTDGACVYYVGDRVKWWSRTQVTNPK